MKVFTKNKKRSVAGQIVWFAVMIILIAGFIIFPQIMPVSWAEYYHDFMYGYISFVPAAIASMFHFSLTELIVVAGGILLIIGFIAFIVIFILKAARGGLGRFLLGVIKPVISVVLVAVIFFDLMMGIGYRRKTVASYLDLKRGDYSYEEYVEVLNWAYRGMVSSRAKIGQDWRGVGHTSRSFESNVRYANSLIDTVAGKYNLSLSINFIRSKPVAASHIWSTTGIVGMYDPILVEANINTDYMDVTSFPMTVCHEICHAKGIAREGDCNLLASLACIHSKDPEFMYAGYYYIFMNLYPVVQDYAKHVGAKPLDYLSFGDMAPVLKDIKASNAYWKSIHDTELAKFIHDLGTSVNNMYLKSNGQQGGVETYHVPDNVYVNFYMTYIKKDLTDA